MECPHCNQKIEDKDILKEAANVAMKHSINEGEKAMPKVVYDFGVAASRTSKNSGHNRHLFK